MFLGNETLYRLFVLVANEKSITKASEKLYISQPAVSKQIKKLELQLNTTLFNRKNMELTENGKKLYNQLEPIFSKLEKIEQTFNSKRDIKLGTYNTLMSKLLSPTITDYYNKFKENNIIIENHDLEEMLEKLKNSKLDIIIVKKLDVNKYKLPSNIKYIKLGNLENIFIYNIKNNLEKSKDLNFLNQKILYIPRNTSQELETLLNTLKENNINLVIKRVDSSTMIQLVKNSSNIGFITKEYILEELKKDEIQELDLNFNISKSEFGMYFIKENTFKELNELIKLMKHNFKL